MKKRLYWLEGPPDPLSLMFEIGCAFRTVTEENILYSDFFLLILSANLGKAECKPAVVALPRLMLKVVNFFLTFSHFSNGGRKKWERMSYIYICLTLSCLSGMDVFFLYGRQIFILLIVQGFIKSNCV